jgi:hypothetical protein
MYLGALYWIVDNDHQAKFLNVPGYKFVFYVSNLTLLRRRIDL